MRLLPIFLLFVLIGCATPILPKEKQQKTLPVVESTVNIGEANADAVSSELSEVNELSSDINLEEFSTFESDLANLNW